MTLEDTQKFQEIGKIMDYTSKILLIAAAMGVVLIALAYFRKKRKEKTQDKPSYSRTVFTNTCIGMIYDNFEKGFEGRHFAVVFDTKGKELCRYEEDNGQIIHGFTANNNILYLHTTDTDEYGRMSESRWMYMPEENEFVSCE